MDELKKKENRQVLESWFVDVDLALEWLLPGTQEKQEIQERFSKLREDALALLD
jgi:hypothetical protein